MTSTRATATSDTAPPDNTDVIHAAIVALGTATAGQIAKHAAMAYSTTTPKLRALEAAGRAEFFRDGNGKGMWRATTASTDLAGNDDEQAAEGIDVNDIPEAAEVDDAPGVDPVSEQTPSDPTGEPHSTTTTTNSRPDPSTPHTTQATTPGDTGVPADTGAKPARRRKGALRQEVLAIFAKADPDQTFKVTQLHHLIGASQGAIYNALVTLQNEGSVVQVVEKPATFRAV